jgi:hypothetical protein
MQILLDIPTSVWYPLCRRDLKIFEGPTEDAAMQKDEIEGTILRIFEVSLEAQLRAVRRLHAGEPEEKPRKRGMSQVDLVEDILRRAAGPLHITEIIDRVERVHGRRLERESVVSALVKKIQRGERFVRTDKNQFALKGGKQ